jgi:Protein of unknown function (DUF1549)/Protein of unknown function (DUF1553)
MKQQTISPRWLLLAVLVALCGFSLVQAAPKKDEAKDKSPAEKKAEKVVLLPSLTGKLDAGALAKEIDQAVAQRLAAEKVKASPLADDAEFLRRVTLDLAGHIPSAEKVAEFLDSKDPGKRAKLIDELLASDEYGKHMADVWKDLLVKRNSDNRFVPFDPLVDWLTKNFNENKPWDQIVRELLTAEGPQDENGAVTYFLANNTVDKMTDSTTKVFLGVQLQCAQCHNHPFTDWKQAEYWGMADFFLNVKLTGPRNPVKQEGSPGIVESKTFFKGKGGRKPPLPDSAKTVPAKFLGGSEMKLDGQEKVRPLLAKWMTSADNPYFSKAMVNRAWFQLFGRGLVNPVDDMNGANEASHPQLLVNLADQFASSGFDLKQLYRALCNSETYQRTSKPAAGNADADPSLFARVAVRVMTPEQEFDSLFQVLAPGKDPRKFEPAKFNKAKMPNVAKYQNFSPRSQFVAFFEAEDATDPTEYQDGIPQALRLMNAPGLNNAVVLNGLLRAGKSQDQIIDHLYMATLSRRPTAKEVQHMDAYVAKHKNEAREGYADVLWVLMNCSEFVMNH